MGVLEEHMETVSDARKGEAGASFTVGSHLGERMAALLRKIVWWLKGHHVRDF